MPRRTQSFLLSVFLVACSLIAQAQTVSPFMALGNAQFFDNNGELLTSGVLYSYQAGTSVQQATYTDYTGLTANPNPIPFTSGARGSIWLTKTAFYKFVLCLQNDGAFCAPADVLFSVDQVPGCPGCSNGGNVFTGTFISGSTSPATTGILALATSDSICWRNQAGTANLCISKDTSDVLEWAGGTIKLPEIGCAGGTANFDYLCADTSTHKFSEFNNGATKLSLTGIATPATAGDFAAFAANGIDLIDSGSTPPATATVPFSATPIFGVSSQNQLLQLTLTGNVTSSTFSIPGRLSPPLLIFIELTQDATGGHTLVWPGHAVNAPYINTAANSVTIYSFLWDGTNAQYIPNTCAIAAKTSAYTLTAGDCIVEASVNSSGFTLTLPHLVTGVNWTITRTDTSHNTLTLAGDTGNVNGLASITLAPNSTALCHANGTQSYCAISVFANSQLIQYGTDGSCASTCTETFPIPYQTAVPTCFCTGINGSCNQQTGGALKASCAYNGSGSLNWMAIGVP